MSREGVPEAVTLGLGCIKGPWDFALGREDQRNAPGQQACSRLSSTFNSVVQQTSTEFPPPSAGSVGVLGGHGGRGPCYFEAHVIPP